MRKHRAAEFYFAGLGAAGDDVGGGAEEDGDDGEAGIGHGADGTPGAAPDAIADVGEGDLRVTVFGAGDDLGAGASGEGREQVAAFIGGFHFDGNGFADADGEAVADGGGFDTEGGLGATGGVSFRFTASVRRGDDGEEIDGSDAAVFLELEGDDTAADAGGQGRQRGLNDDGPGAVGDSAACVGGGIVPGAEAGRIKRHGAFAEVVEGDGLGAGIGSLFGDEDHAGGGDFGAGIGAFGEDVEEDGDELGGVVGVAGDFDAVVVLAGGEAGGVDGDGEVTDFEPGFGDGAGVGAEAGETAAADGEGDG